MRTRGVALVTALLVVAIASLAATALMSTANLAIHRTASLRDSEAAWWVARGVEAWITGILKQDFQQQAPPKYDGLDEAWAQPVDALPIDQGFLRGQLVDQMGLFNLNNLLLPASNPLTPKYEAHFTGLLQEIQNNSKNASLQMPPVASLIGAIRDWGDADQNPSAPFGAEDGSYLGRDPGYRTADRPFTVISELRAVDGMTPELYAALSPLLAALPETGTATNVNTAPIEVLYAIPGAARPQVESFVGSRTVKPAQTMNDIDPSLKGPLAPPVGVDSRWFQIRGEVFVGSSRVALYSLINRSASGTSTVLAHSADAE